MKVDYSAADMSKPAEVMVAQAARALVGSRARRARACFDDGALVALPARSPRKALERFHRDLPLRYEGDRHAGFDLATIENYVTL